MTKYCVYPFDWCEQDDCLNPPANVVYMGTGKLLLCDGCLKVFEKRYRNNPPKLEETKLEVIDCFIFMYGGERTGKEVTYATRKAKKARPPKSG
jgi:hypothetical protein